MIKKSVNGQIVTQKDFQSLKSEFGGLRTEFGGLKTGFKGLKSEFKATRKSLFSQILTLEEKLEQLDETNKGYKDEIMTGLDKIMGELQTIREESAAGTLQLQRLRKDVDNHEERISSLEIRT